MCNLFLLGYLWKGSIFLYQRINHYTWRCLWNDWVWHLVLWFNWHSGVWSKTWLFDLGALFYLEQFYNCLILDSKHQERIFSWQWAFFKKNHCVIVKKMEILVLAITLRSPVSTSQQCLARGGIAGIGLSWNSLSGKVSEGGGPWGYNCKKRAHCTISAIHSMQNYFRLFSDASQHGIHIKTWRPNKYIKESFRIQKVFGFTPVTLH